MLREDRFYIISPIDILLAQKRDAADHIDWLLQKRDYEVCIIVYACTLRFELGSFISSLLLLSLSYILGL